MVDGGGMHTDPDGIAERSGNRTRKNGSNKFGRTKMCDEPTSSLIGCSANADASFSSGVDKAPLGEVGDARDNC